MYAKFSIVHVRGRSIKPPAATSSDSNLKDASSIQNTGITKIIPMAVRNTNANVFDAGILIFPPWQTSVGT
jgi:hypothetical protein